MKLTRCNKSLSFILCMVLIAAMALTGCTNNTQNTEAQTTLAEEITTVEETTVAEETTAAEAANEDITVLGEGQTVFTFTVVDGDGVSTVFEIHTDKTIVGEALLELRLIAGEEGPYGLYIKTVNGITADYDTDHTYWAFYINDSYAMSGVDTTDIAAGDSYCLKVEKG